MSGFDGVIFLWFASAMLVTAIGYFRGQAADAMTMGVFLGPIALVVTVVLVARGRLPLRESPPILKIPDADRRRPGAAESKTRLRRAA
jgi:hypothetical protein